MKFKILFLFLFLILIDKPCFAYIDPGIGSALFSIVLGIVGSLYFVFYAIYFRIKNLFLSKKDLEKAVHPFVIYSEGSQYYNLFKPILEIADEKKLDLTYFTSSKDDKILNEKFNTIKTKYIGKNTEAYFKLAFLKADVCLMTTPGLDVLQLKRSKYTKYYCHIFHTMVDTLVYKLFSLDYYDGVLCDGEFQIPMIRELETKRNTKHKDLEVVGCCYMDFQNEKLKNLSSKKDKFTVLLAPSWGIDCLLRKSGEKLIDNLTKEANWDIIIRPHPQSLKTDKKFIDKLMKKYQNIDNIYWNFDSDNLEIMSQSDILISDFSGIVFDWVFLFNKPFLYFNKNLNEEIYDYYDLDDYSYRRKMIEDLGIELNIDDLENIIEVINKIKMDSNFVLKVEKYKNEVWQKQGCSALNVVNFLIQKQQELQNGN